MAPARSAVLSEARSAESKGQDDKVTAAVRGLYGDFVRTFGNVLFAVSLFVVWGVLTLLGVVIVQGRDPNAYFESYAAPIARAI